jgi:hypothetical protein
VLVRYREKTRSGRVRCYSIAVRSVSLCDEMIRPFPGCCGLRGWRLAGRKQTKRVFAVLGCRRGIVGRFFLFIHGCTQCYRAQRFDTLAKVVDALTLAVGVA